MASVSAVVGRSQSGAGDRHLRIVTEADVRQAQQVRELQWQAVKAGYPAPMRLTKRGRRLVAFLIFMPIAFFLWFNSSHQVAAEDRAPKTHTVVVQPGQTLWDVAVASHLNGDPRQSVYEIKQINHLSSAQVWPGQALIIPTAR